ncbi:hypothetical protein B1R32_11249 [Abditibacterium utsteinense]|uniref:Rhodanese domain-containing protein n=1 Tax=Abditibacterium utsteinense TaxID=1960156 RepID=A0A2S8SRG0_9BACT|nr:hypothetical protein [Abditibacterium utsteinense]PQV63394.1 hypothetical protein B1R32_11249 [Abditibacterium utsteinense]
MIGDQLHCGTSLLPVFSSTAQASWSGPVYAVSNRQGDIRGNVAATTPNNGDDAYPSVAQAGTVKATFTWTHDVPGDSPPADVYVLQSGYAKWQLLGPPPAGAMSRPSASVQSVAFSPAREPRIYLAQTQTAYGTANDGLGHAQVVTTSANGQIGISQGYKPVLCHPTGDTLVTSAVTLSASATSKQTYIASWSYSAQILNLQITRNGRDVTNPKNPEVPVMVGERNQMGVSVSPSPQIPTYQWTIPGDKIKDYLETPVSPNTTPPFTGKKVELPAADLQTPSPHFYWYNGSFTGESREVSVVVTLYGTPMTIKSKFKVYRPRMGSFTGTFTPRIPPIGLSTYPTTINGQTVLIDFLGLGTQATGGNKGITYVAQVSTPNIAVAAGQIAYVQLITADSETKITDEKHTTTQVTDALDNGQPSLTYHGTDAIAAGATEQAITRDDTPGGVGNNFNANGDFFKQNSQFKTYLMYKPSNTIGIWVPLGLLNWSVSFKVTLNEAANPPWDFTNLFPTRKPDGSPPDIIQGNGSTTFPEFTQRIQDNPGVPVSTNP